MKKTVYVLGLCMVLSRFICNVRCIIIDNIKLKISRVIDDTYSELLLGVEEQVGNNLTLNCDLFSSDNASYDDSMAWGKTAPGFIFKNESDLETLAKKKSPQVFAYFYKPTQQMNRAVKTFTPLKDSDAGTYFCGSLKYMKFKIVNIKVKSTGNLTTTWVNYNRKMTNFYCNERMFKCKSSGACINQHYVCDKKPDCMDGSDESWETCNGDPCQDKLECEDGRCIPTDWCCDRHLDPNCTVTYRPPCCQLHTAAYDEPEYFVPNNMTQPVRQNGSRFFFITLCILATFFSMLLMLLILSKIFMLAKKARCMDARMEQLYLDDCAHHLHRAVAVRSSHSPMIRNYNYRAGIVCQLPSAGANDALLVLSDDILRRGSVEVSIEGDADERPPSYTDVMSLEPPPPYTSQDCLNRT